MDRIPYVAFAVLFPIAVKLLLTDGMRRRIIFCFLFPWAKKIELLSPLGEFDAAIMVPWYGIIAYQYTPKASMELVGTVWKWDF